MIKNLKDEVTQFVEHKKEIVEFNTKEITKDNIGSLYITIVKDKTDGTTASDVYVRNKTKKLRERLGETFVKIIEIDETSNLNEIVRSESNNKDCVGLIVQKPSKYFSDDAIQLICSLNLSPYKDIDSITPKQLGLVTSLGMTSTLPLTARGMINFLDNLMKDSMEGKSLKETKVATVIGRSIIVGKPMVMALINRGYTVFNVNSKTDRVLLRNMLRYSDVVITAVGKHGVITNNYLKHGCIVLDVGINRDNSGKLCGDLRIDDTGCLDFSYTPVPGGIGKITSNEFYCKVLQMVQHKFEEALNEK